MTLGWDNPTADPTTTILLRHGDTRLSPEHRFSGLRDLPLSASGTIYRLYLGSACINEIQWHGRGFAAVHCVNDTSHLP